MPRWQYKPDEEPKRKHAWSRDYAGFVEVGGVFVGKCPHNLPLSRAEEMANEGIPYFPKRWTRSYPNRIYVIDGGVLYRIAWTVPGVSCHGFPEHPSEWIKLPRTLRAAVLDRARELGQLDQVEKWLGV